jgi:DinB family protein
MVDINAALAASKDAVEQLIAAGERTGSDWTAPRAQGKWSPSQVVEHVARSLEESANAAAGRPSKFPKLPAVVHPLVRTFLFKRVLKKAAFPKAKTNKAMDPASGPATPAAGRARLETAHQQFDQACRQLASRGERMRTTVFGAVAVEDYVRFMELHTRHHGKQIANRA